ncbi:MAG: SRPBCC family protein [Ilyomonas sp.]
MRFFKLALISIVVLFALITAIGLLFPKDVTTTRTITIHAPADSLYHYLADVKHWKLWMQGAKDTTIQFLSAKTSGAGTVAKIGSNEVSISKATPSSIQMIWEGERGSIMTSGFEILSDPSHHVTTVEWYFQQHLQWYPWQRFSSMLNEKMLGPGMEKSLDNLREVAEEK